MSQPEPQQSSHNPITFLVAAAGHTHGPNCMSFSIVAQNHSQITPTFIADEANRQHGTKCPCPWRGSRNYIYVHREDLTGLFASERLQEMGSTSPLSPHALIPSLEDWVLATGFTASRPADQTHFVICHEPRDTLKRKASTSLDDEPGSTSKQTKFNDDLCVTVKDFDEDRIIIITNKRRTRKGSPTFVPQSIHKAFHSPKPQVILADQTRCISSAFEIAGDTVGWGFYASPESRPDLSFLRQNLTAVLDIDPDVATNFPRMFTDTRLLGWFEEHPEYVHSRSFVLFFKFNALTPTRGIEQFKEDLDEAIYESVDSAVEKYAKFAEWHSLPDIIEGCTGADALHRVLFHVSKRRCSSDSPEIVVIVEDYDHVARIAHSADIVADPSKVLMSLDDVTRCFHDGFYRILANTVDPTHSLLAIDRLILFGLSPAFAQHLCLSLPFKDLSSIPGVPGLTVGQVRAQVAYIFGLDTTDDPRIKLASSALAKSCPVYSYTDNTTVDIEYHFPRGYLTAFFITIAEKPDATSQDIQKALALRKVKPSDMPESVLAAASKLYGRGVQFWEHTATSDLLNERLEVRVAEGLRLRLRYHDIPKDVITADSSREITEITPFHVAQFLVEEGVLTWRHGIKSDQCYYTFPSTGMKNQFIRDVVERSLLRTYNVPAMYREPAAEWLKEVLTKHFKNRPLASVVHIVENVPQTALDIITEMSLATSGEVYGYSFMELQTQSGSRIDNAMFIFESQKQRPRASLWELKSIPVGDILEATMCRTLDRQPNNSVEYSTFPEIEAFIKHLHAFPASEWDAPDYTSDRRRWPKAPDSLTKDWVPTKLKHLFYWGYDNSDPKRKARRVRYSIYNVISVSDNQIGRYGREVARDSSQLPVQNSASDFPDIGGLRDDRVHALPASPAVNDTIDLGTVILLAGRFVITRNVGSVKTNREFRVVKTQR